MTTQAHFRKSILPRLLSRYGMVFILLFLCIFFTYKTYHDDQATGAAGANSLAASVEGVDKQSRIVIIAQTDSVDGEFADTLQSRLTASGFTKVHTIRGGPPDVREGLESSAKTDEVPDVILTTPACRQWTLFDSLKSANPAFARIKIQSPAFGRNSTFLSASNLRNVADQVAVIAILAIGMTMVILTGGIDLSVGSLLALSAVVTAWLIQKWGGSAASSGVMAGAALCAILLMGAVGLFSGLMITRLRIPPFIATLAMMQVASGLAFIISQGQSINDIPASFTWLGRGVGFASLPIAVLLMILLYLGSNWLMLRTVIGRHIYAVGGNSEASRLSGIEPKKVLLFVYLVSALGAGIGGVITASQLKAGSPNFGQMYELYVIASVVVGGTSLVGGEGFIFGTLIGAFIIAVIRNGMNLMNIEPYTQKVVLGFVILGAVSLDRLRRSPGKNWFARKPKQIAAQSTSE
ncbi:MAG: ABC transporter permease [Chthonomonadales bacterium]